jgi:hypothetical protein
MEKLKDELDKQTQSYLSLNFLMADYCGEIDEEKQRVSNLVFSDGGNYSLTPEDRGGEGATDNRELYFSAIYHKYISRTFDIGKCRKEE